MWKLIIQIKFCRRKWVKASIFFYQNALKPVYFFIKISENNLDDGCGWNIYGILTERIGLRMMSSMAFKKASIFCDKTVSDKANINYGRLLMKLGKYSESVDVFKGIKEANFNSGIGLALSLFKGEYFAFIRIFPFTILNYIKTHGVYVEFFISFIFQKHQNVP